MRILVTGSRDWTDRQTIFQALLRTGVEGMPGDDHQRILVHGDAKGADTIAAEVAKRMGWKVEPHPADWKLNGKAAGNIRNSQMVHLGADVCLAFPLSGSRGTRDCMQKAEAAGIRVIAFTPRVDPPRRGW